MSSIGNTGLPLDITKSIPHSGHFALALSIFAGLLFIATRTTAAMIKPGTKTKCKSGMKILPIAAIKQPPPYLIIR